MLFTHLATVSFLTLFNGAVALPTSNPRSAAIAAGNAYDLSVSRGIAALKELSAEQATIFVAQPPQWNAVAKRISEKTNNVIVATKFSAQQMRAAPALGSVDALALWSPVQNLVSAADEAMKNFVKMKSIVFQMNNGQQAVLALLAGLKDSNKEFTLAMSKKMPIGGNYVGEYYGNSVDSIISNTIKEFQTAPAVAAGSSWW